MNRCAGGNTELTGGCTLSPGPGVHMESVDASGGQSGSEPAKIFI